MADAASAEATSVYGLCELPLAAPFAPAYVLFTYKTILAMVKLITAVADTPFEVPV